MFAQRMNRLGTETAFEVLAKAKALEAEGRDIVHMEIGEPDFATPENIVDAGCRALREGHTHYGPSAGLPELREAIAEDVSRTRGIEVHPDQVVVTPGAKPILFFAALALLEPGDEALYPDPGFPIYESVINFAGAKPVPVPLREENEFALAVEDVAERIGPKTKLLIVNSPQNPTGSVLRREDVEQIAQLAVEHNLIVLSDEVYNRILFEGEHVSFASIPGMQERTILVDGFSKTYAMTGWRIGYSVSNRQLAEKFARLQTNSNSCTATFTQIACIEALRGPQDAVDKMVAEFRRRREFIVRGLNELPGVSCVLPHGAFYVFPNVKKTGFSCRELQERMLEEAGVALLSGTCFGKYGEGYLRLSYATSLERIEECLSRMRRWLEEHGVEENAG